MSKYLLLIAIFFSANNLKSVAVTKPDPNVFGPTKIDRVFEILAIVNMSLFSVVAANMCVNYFRSKSKDDKKYLIKAEYDIVYGHYAGNYPETYIRYIKTTELKQDEGLLLTLQYQTPVFTFNPFKGKNGQKRRSNALFASSII